MVVLLTAVPVPAREAGAPASGGAGGLAGFLLVVVLGFFGYHLYSSYRLNARMDRLEGGEAPVLVPFSWDPVVRGLESGFPILSDLRLPRPGLVLVGTPGEPPAQELRARILRTLLSDPARVALFAGPRSRAGEVARRLLGLEAGVEGEGPVGEAWEALQDRLGSVLDRYEESLFLVTDPQADAGALAAVSRELERREGEVAGILVDPDHFSPEGLLEDLRQVAFRAHAPVVIVLPTEHPLWEQGRDGSPAACAVVEFREQDGGWAPTFHRFPGEAGRA